MVPLRSLRLAASTFVVLLLAACAAKAPAPDPFAQFAPELDRSAFKSLTLAFITTENVEQSREKVKPTWASFTGGSGSFDQVLQGVAEVLKRNFGQVTRVQSMEEAVALNPDLVAVFDSDGRFSSFTEHIDVTAKLSFMSPDGKRLDTIRAESHRKEIMMGGDRVARKFEAARKEIEENLERSLHASARLQEAAKARAAGLAAGAPAAKPAAVFHSDVDLPGYATPERPDDMALVVGIEKYANIPDALFAERDAAAVRAHLIALGYPARNIIHLSGQQASRASLQKYVETWLPKNVKPTSRVFVYFSGHGAPDTKSKQAFLVPWDGDPRFLEDTGFGVRRLYKSLGELKAKQVVVALDACFSGAGGRSVLPAGARPLVTRVDTAEDEAATLAVLAAASPEEITGSAEGQGHGLFTYQLLRGLSGEARDASGQVTVKGLYEYLRPRVQEEARRENRDQDPQFLGAGGDLVLRAK